MLPLKPIWRNWKVFDPRYMQMAVTTAEKARGKCSPNPFVGAVIVKDGTLISTGWTQAYGSDHAEVQAIKKAGAECRGAEIYVTLEPCSHYGKTPPCAKAIIEAGISAVYIGLIDPNPLVAGKGIKMLEEAGIIVEHGHYSEEITKQLEYYLCRILKGRPFVSWKTALSLDGKYAASDGSSKWISSPKSRALVQRLRSEMDVILTGISTVEQDDPLLNVREIKSSHQPTRVVLDARLQISLETKLVQTAKTYPTIILCDHLQASSLQADKLRKLGLEVLGVTCQAQFCDLPEVLKTLHDKGFYSVMLECGSELSSAFFKAGLVDKVQAFVAPLLLGGSKSMLEDIGVKNITEAIRLKDSKIKRLGEDIWVVGRVNSDQ